jgi:hypothetical protein
MTDTHPKIEEEMLRRFRAMTPAERLERGVALMQAGRKFAEIAVRKRFPNLSGLDFQRELVRYLYGDKCAELVR